MVVDRISIFFGLIGVFGCSVELIRWMLLFVLVFCIDSFCMWFSSSMQMFLVIFVLCWSWMVFILVVGRLWKWLLNLFFLFCSFVSCCFVVIIIGCELVKCCVSDVSCRCCVVICCLYCMLFLRQIFVLLFVLIEFDVCWYCVSVVFVCLRLVFRCGFLFFRKLSILVVLVCFVIMCWFRYDCVSVFVIVVVWFGFLFLSEICMMLVCLFCLFIWMLVWNLLIVLRLLQ